MAWKTQNSSTTNHTCGGPVFGKKTAGCPRCDEMIAGAPAVKGWGAVKKENEARFYRSLRTHCCKSSGCLPICTFGDW